MGSDLTRLIEACFLEHDGDGEFLSGVRGFPYSVIGRWVMADAPSSQQNR